MSRAGNVKHTALSEGETQAGLQREAWAQLTCLNAEVTGNPTDWESLAFFNSASGVKVPVGPGWLMGGEKAAQSPGAVLQLVDARAP